MNKKELKQILRYLIVGGTATGVDYCAYIFLSETLNISIAKAISMIIAMGISFVLNKIWTFNSHNEIRKQIRRYMVSQAINLCTNVLINTIVFQISQNKIIAFIIATGIAMCANYLLQKKYVFV